MTLDVGDQSIRIEARQPEIPEPRCVVMKQRHLALDVLVQRRCCHGAVKFQIHGDQRTEVATADRIFKARKGPFHRRDLLRLRTLGAERRAVALKHDACLEHILEFAQAQFGNDGANAGTAQDHALDRQPIQRVADRGEANAEARDEFLFVDDRARLKVRKDDRQQKLLVGVRALRGNGTIGALRIFGHVNLA